MRCSACERALDASAFSNTQRKKKGQRRCQECIEGQKVQPADDCKDGIDGLSLACCRFCLADESVAQLVAPCRCTGTSRFVHPRCLIVWQQHGHLNECEVCHAPWTMGLDASAVPPTTEIASEISRACEQAVMIDDAGALRRRLSAYIYREHGSTLLQLAAAHGKRAALRALLGFAAQAGAALPPDGQARRTPTESALCALIDSFFLEPLSPSARQATVSAVKLLTSEGVTLPEDVAAQLFFLQPGEGPLQGPSVPPNAQGAPGANSRLLMDAMTGNLPSLALLFAVGHALSDPNAVQHRYSSARLSPLSMAILYAPPARRGATVVALIDAGADVDYCDDRATPLITALYDDTGVDQVEVVLRLLEAGASTSLVHPSSGSTALVAAADPSGRNCTSLYQMLLLYIHTGLTGHTDEFVSRKPQHVYVEAALARRAASVDLSAQQLRESGNKCVARRDWSGAVLEYSMALAKEGEGRGTEAHKTLANRSLAHLRLAQSHTEPEEALPHVMEALDLRRQGGGPGMNTLDDAIGTGRLTRGQAYRVLAYADARRSVVLAPTWAKAHGRVAEAARELALACLRTGDEEGQSFLKTVCRCAYEDAGKLEPTGDWLMRSMAAEKELSVQAAAGFGDERTKGEQLSDFLSFIKERARITHADLANAGFRPSEADAERLTNRTMADAEADELMAQLDRAIASDSELKRKLKRLHQGGTDEPATEDAARKVPKAGGEDWWAMSWSTVRARGPEGERRWILSVMDSTPPPHPHTNKILFSQMFDQPNPPSVDDCKTALVSAIVHPAPATGSARRPTCVVLAWRMRHIFPAIQTFTASLGFEAHLEEEAVAAGIARAYGTDIEGINC